MSQTRHQRSFRLNPSLPFPLPDDISRQFFEGLAKKQLLVQHCSDCGFTQLGSLRCLRCHRGDLPWRPASGRATLYSHARVHTLYHPAFADRIPYDIALVELEEGPQLYASLTAMGQLEPVVGMPLQVSYSTLPDGHVLPMFAPYGLAQATNHFPESLS